MKFSRLVFLSIFLFLASCAKQDCPPVYTAGSKPSRAERKIAKKKAKAQRKFDKAMLKKKAGHEEFQDRATRKRMKKRYKEAEKRYRKRNN